MLYTLRNRNKSADKRHKDIWVRAWENYKLTAFHNIKPPTCFRVSSEKSRIRREEYRLIYRIHAVKHFLPYFRKMEPHLKGKAKKQTQGIIRFLQGWKTTLPPNTDLSIPKKLLRKSNKNLPPPPQKDKPLQGPAVPVEVAPRQHGEQEVFEDLDHLSSDESDVDIDDLFGNVEQWPLTKRVGRRNPLSK